ncbi:MAG TPA: hypothetical protein VNB90_04350 [Cytophagaceae bacterium]|jgi:hypothetical protein|nr:hypothetical protein [Cytophagaceae bacterium]
MYKQSDILKQLESAGNPDPYKFFPMLENDNYLSSNRINLFADETRWAIVFEIVSYSTQAGCIVEELIYFGNCLTNLDKAGLYNQYTCNAKYPYGIVLIEDLEAIQTGFELVSPDAKTIKIRNQVLPIEHDVNKYEAKGIPINDYENPEGLIDFAALTRYLNEEYPEPFRATDKELYTCLPDGLPKLMAIDKWHYRYYYVSSDYPTPEPGTRPSEYETFQLIADILVSKDVSLWKPTLEPNNDWRNWQNGVL